MWGIWMSGLLVPLLAAQAPQPAPEAEWPHKAVLPFRLYADGESLADMPYYPSGWIGDWQAIAYQGRCLTNPCRGDACMRFGVSSVGGWAGVAWQSPPDDWGKKPGGLDLTGAKKLTFWARGEEGGEVVSFSFGGIEGDAEYPDSDKDGLDNVHLSQKWRPYSISLKGKNLSCIKTGFMWVVGANTKPVVFYLDEIIYE